MVGAAVAGIVGVLTIHVLVGLGSITPRDARLTPSGSIGAAATFRSFVVESEHDGAPVRTVLVAGVSGAAAPVPPGLPHFPAAGTAFVSPALERAIARDPALLSRVPGRIVGEIGADGLVTPQAMQAVAATDGSGWAMDASVRWGAAAGSGVFGAATGATRLMVLGVVGTPVAVLLLCVAAVASALASRRSAQLVLLGASPAQVRAFAASFVASSTVPALCGGALLGMPLARIVGASGVVGLAWFAPSWIVSTAAAVVVCLVGAMALRLAGAILARRAPGDPYRVRGTRVFGAGAWAWRIGLVALGLVGAMTAARWVVNSASEASTLLMLAFLTCLLAAIGGGSAGLAARLRRAADRAPNDRPLALWLAWRRIGHDSGLVVALAAVMAVMAVVVTVGGAVELVVTTMNGDASGQRWWTASLLGADGTEASRAAATSGAAVLQRVGDDGADVWGTCPDLAAVFGNVAEADGAPCEGGKDYPAASLYVDGEPLAAVGGTPAVVHTRTLDPVRVTGDPDKVVFYLTARVDDPDRWQDEILAASPAVAFTKDGDDQAGLVARTVSVERALSLIGFLVVGVALVVALRREGPLRESDRRALRLGARPGAVAATRTVTTALVLSSASVVALVVGVAFGQAYLAVISIYLVDLGSLGRLTGALVLLVVVTSIADGCVARVELRRGARGPHVQYR
jgi:hypothetical protein